MSRGRALWPEGEKTRLEMVKSHSLLKTLCFTALLCIGQSIPLRELHRHQCQDKAYLQEKREGSESSNCSVSYARWVWINISCPQNRSGGVGGFVVLGGWGVGGEYRGKWTAGCGFIRTVVPVTRKGFHVGSLRSRHFGTYDNIYGKFFYLLFYGSHQWSLK